MKILILLITAQWHIVIDNQIIEVVSEVCPECEHTHAIVHTDGTWIEIKHELIFKGGFDGLQGNTKNNGR